MAEPVCRLDEFFVTRLHLDWREPKKDTKTELRYDFDYDVARHVQEPLRRRLALRVSARSTSTPPVGIEFDTEIVGFFAFPEDMEKGTIEQLIRVNGCSILYGILRGQLAQATGSMPGGKFVLPTFMMHDVVAEIEAEKADKKKAKPAKKKVAKKKTKSAKKGPSPRARPKRRIRID
ncbi:MAG: hypothetical protein KJ626_00125 [Verrucomicrobia bacterium]|nr:hypothetical protein [Verrucomicrobiota bacterium]